MAKRFNVALTRGKALNVIVGNPLVLESDPCWRRLIEFTAERGSYRGCRCLTAKGTDACDDDDANADDSEALVTQISKIGLLGASCLEDMYPTMDNGGLDNFFRCGFSAGLGPLLLIVLSFLGLLTLIFLCMLGPFGLSLRLNLSRDEVAWRVQL